MPDAELKPPQLFCWIRQDPTPNKDGNVSKVLIDESRCKGCALCTLACPKKLIRMSDKLNRQGFLPAVFPEECNRDCTSCALCAQMCPDVAISVCREEKGEKP